ncbi:3-hydroxyisobutyrate dehydrogenase-like beta-hydroxyacid dehydrogenase [Actinoalloteichus hoggarensis]|uniref:NAD binding domain of 6-phosphogluconate dehydrogenase n=1 Tax=Actinoalloteichus hoggarensis TaxID=1470176 RepID=A0A221VXN8_9PSEU|nr:NAD(P)-binding domain-containing protein [Actinoalloteichus hoggarensis]ASO18306.1 NAD binding domain of 6-phosphogluconate dehydrogenase [Actinoalloteichus hoggarensis]MBB5921668.1 3-hydroxyisobutyrate dehydrogenase-like beta-hydroxyacid dehydrogenase [Actinoalloteichus hoggarensis]
MEIARQSESIAVIGANARAAGLARALLHTGHAITVWSPTPDADAAPALRIDGVRSADSWTSALGAAPLVVLCVDDYDELRLILDEAGGHALTAHDVVNLTSGTSEEADRAADRVAALGGRYLDGALMAHPEHVGDSATILVFSGSAEVFERRSAVLACFGSASYLGPAAGTAALYDVAMLGFAWSTLLGYLYTAVLLGTSGVPATTLTPLLTGWLTTTVVDVIEDYAGQVDARRYPGDEEWLELDFPLMGHLVRTSRERGLDTRLPRLIEALTSDGIADGRGRESFAGLVEILRRQSAGVGVTGAGTGQNQHA